MVTNKLIDIKFTLEWKSPVAAHVDAFHVIDIDTKHDIFLADFADKITDLALNESYSHIFQAKDLLGEGFSSDKVISFAAEKFNTRFKGQNSPPILYRFYPSAIASEGLNTKEKDFTPFRLISISKDKMVADCNHPLAKYYLTLTATKLKQSEQKTDKRRSINIVDLVTSRGPGMQAPFEFGEPVFFDSYPLKRNGNEIDLEKPDINKATHTEIAKLYSELLPKYSKTLDLMSAEESYLTEDYETGLLAGIGSDKAKLNVNPRLNTFHQQNLNTDSTLPFEDNSFDNAICTLAINTLTDPLAVFKEIARVVQSKGRFIITFTNNFDLSQTIDLWPQLHAFERMQLVLEYFRHSEAFNELNTLSIRGNSKSNTESVFAVWGTVS